MQSITHYKGTRLDMLETLPKHGVCAEVGVLEGVFSEEILYRCPPKHLYLVDIFRGKCVSGDQDGKNIHTVDMDDMRWNLAMKFADMPVTIVASDSIEWLASQSKGSLDWIYVDTTHSFERTAGEIITARDAVKHGGYICGHDYHSTFNGVIQAVNAFCDHYCLSLEIWEGDGLPSYKITNSICQQNTPQEVGADRI